MLSIICVHPLLAMERQQARMPDTLGIHLGCGSNPNFAAGDRYISLFLQLHWIRRFTSGKRLRECRKLPGIKEQERKELKFKKQGSRWDREWRSGPICTGGYL